MVRWNVRIAKRRNSLKRVNNLFDSLISDENLQRAIYEVDKSHHWKSGHKPNHTTAWVEMTKERRVEGLRTHIIYGFVERPPRVVQRYDVSAKKWRIISEPIQYPDQYIHHALIQVLQPIMMRGMDKYCCGSIRGRGTHYAKRAIEGWIKHDKNGTRYCLSMDIRHFYDNLDPNVVMDRMRSLIKDYRVLDLIWRVIKNGIKIGAYPSQWFANTTLQPMDMMIRQSGLCEHYVRYMDNITIFGSNKSNLKRLKIMIEQWLNFHRLEVKGDWQLYPTNKRLPNAVGYVYGKTYTLPRKNNFLRLKRTIAKYRRNIRDGKTISTRLANSILSRLGQLKHCNNCNLYSYLFKGEKIVRELKQIVSKDKRSLLTWEEYINTVIPV